MVIYLPNSSTGVCDIRNFFSNASGSHLFLSERDSDVAITVEWDGRTWHLPAHRLVLVTMSEVFRKMFDTNMSEKKHGKVTIRDSSPFTVKQFLKYLYTGSLDFSNWTEALDLMKIAHKYGVQTLVALCESYLITSLSLSNACCLYEAAMTYFLDSLEKQTAALILDAAFIVSATDGFHNLKPKSLEFFLKSSLLNVENECCVLTTLREWAFVSCSKKGMLLTRENVLSEMKPFMKYIKWTLIPEQLRTYVPKKMVQSYLEQVAVRRRKNFHVPSTLQHHISTMKFIVELGRFYENTSSDNFSGLSCLRFGVDNHAYIAGFKIVGLFRKNVSPSMDRSSLILGRDDNKSFTVFNLNSLPWSKGASSDGYIWRELLAYFPFPVRVDPFSMYVVTIKFLDGRNSLKTKWPYTRLDSGVINSSLGTMNFHSCSECYGITQLFLLPAPPIRNTCNDDS